MKYEIKGDSLPVVICQLEAGEQMLTEGGPGMIAFASSFPGSIKPFQITPGNDMICQKSAFLAGEMGVQLSVAVNKKIGSGFFGGEGFIM